MNNKGQTMFLSIAIGILIFIAGMLFLNFLIPEVQRVQAPSSFDCDNASGITDGTKLSCLFVDSVIPYYILLVLSFSGGIITDRFLK